MRRAMASSLRYFARTTGVGAYKSIQTVSPASIEGGGQTFKTPIKSSRGLCCRSRDRLPGSIAGGSHCALLPKAPSPGDRHFSSSATSWNSLVGSDGFVRSPFNDISIPTNLTLADYVLSDVDKHGDSIALIDGVTGRKLSYEELKESIVNVASGLTRLGLKKDDVITICAPNSIEWVIMYLAASVTGTVVSAVNPLYTEGELTHAVGHSSSKYIITIKELSSIALKVKEQCPNVKEVIVFSDCEGCRPFSSLLKDDGLAYPDSVSVDPVNDVVALPYSSGTTGLPKGVMLTHHNIISNVEQLRHEEMLPYKPGDTLMGVLPFFHIYGQVVVMLGGLKGGATVITLPKFEPELFLNAASSHKASYLHVVPPIVLFLAKHPLVTKYNFDAVTDLFVGAAPCGSEMIGEAVSRVNKNAMFRQGYGLTECSPVTNANPRKPSNNKHHTVGPAVANTIYKIVDIESGAILKQGQEGELCVRGPQVMKGYYKNESATDSTIMDGFLHTGDVGYYDEDGHVVITDRLKELIKYKGFQVAPAELEALLVTHPAILDAAVIGKPDEKAGELPRAYVVLSPNQSLSPEDIHGFLKDKVASFKQLSGGIEFRTEIPKSAAGKILRRVLKDELKAQN